jgi:hypothetical protein
VNLFTNPIGGIAPVGLAPPVAVTANQNADAALALWESTLAATLASTINDSAALAVPSAPATMTDMVFDPATQSFMLEMVDVLTGNVISEEPIAAQLQFQALAQLMAGASTAAQAQASGAINIQA